MMKLRLLAVIFIALVLLFTTTNIKNEKIMQNPTRHTPPLLIQPSIEPEAGVVPVPTASTLTFTVISFSYSTVTFTGIVQYYAGYYILTTTITSSGTLWTWVQSYGCTPGFTAYIAVTDNIPTSTLSEFYTSTAHSLYLNVHVISTGTISNVSYYVYSTIVYESSTKIINSLGTEMYVVLLSTKTTTTVATLVNQFGSGYAIITKPGSFTVSAFFSSFPISSTVTLTNFSIDYNPSYQVINYIAQNLYTRYVSSSSSVELMYNLTPFSGEIRPLPTFVAYGAAANETILFTPNNVSTLSPTTIIQSFDTIVYMMYGTTTITFSKNYLILNNSITYMFSTYITNHSTNIIYIPSWYTPTLAVNGAASVTSVTVPFLVPCNFPGPILDITSIDPTPTGLNTYIVDGVIYYAYSKPTYVLGSTPFYMSLSVSYYVPNVSNVMQGSIYPIGSTEPVIIVSIPFPVSTTQEVPLGTSNSFIVESKIINSTAFTYTVYFTYGNYKTRIQSFVVVPSSSYNHYTETFVLINTLTLYFHDASFVSKTPTPRVVSTIFTLPNTVINSPLVYSKTMTIIVQDTSTTNFNVTESQNFLTSFIVVLPIIYYTYTTIYMVTIPLKVQYTVTFVSSTSASTTKTAYNLVLSTNVPGSVQSSAMHLSAIVLYIMLAIVFLVMLWCLYRYATSVDDEERRKYKKCVIYSIIAVFIIFFLPHVLDWISTGSW